MLRANEFIKQEIGQIARSFPNVQFKYAFNKDIQCHIIEITPLEQFNSNLALDKAWIPVSINFQEQYPKDEIAFISSDSILKIENPEFAFNEVAKVRLFHGTDLLNENISIRYTVSFPSNDIVIQNRKLVISHIDLNINSSTVFPNYTDFDKTVYKSHQIVCVKSNSVFSELPNAA